MDTYGFIMDTIGLSWTLNESIMGTIILWVHQGHYRYIMGHGHYESIMDIGHYGSIVDAMGSSGTL
jgi:hypothetical protein